MDNITINDIITYRRQSFLNSCWTLRQRNYLNTERKRNTRETTAFAKNDSQYERQHNLKRHSLQIKAKEPFIH